MSNLAKQKTKLYFFRMLIVLIVAVLTTPCAWAANPNNDNNAQIHNIIMMVPDGCAQSIQTLARWVKGAPLNVDGLNTGMVKTFMADSIITDSASAATAFACGHKTSNGFLGVGPRSDTLLTGFTATARPYAPIASVLEGAKYKGKSTGLIATSRITHATPAGFASHVHDRGLDNEIMEHMVYENVDVVFGGGARHLIPSGTSYTTTFGDSWGGKRTDGEDLMQVLLDNGYQFVDNKTDMMALTDGPVWGLFDDSHMDPELDRDDLHPTQPSIAEMTEKAIELLSKNNKGFFLMVEGSQIDWAGHANDGAYMTFDFLAFDDAVGKALDFAKEDGHTLVLVFPDHNTGALTIGHEMTDFPPGYTGTTIEDLIDPIKDATMTIQQLLYEIPSPATAQVVIDTFAQYHGDYWSENMTLDQAQYVADTLNASGPYYAYYPIAEYVSKNLTIFGWTTHGHTGEDVPLWAYGLNRPMGTLDNTELATLVADAFKFSLKDMTTRLFCDISASDGYQLDTSDPNNPVIKFYDAEFPVNKNIMRVGASEFLMEGIVVYAPETNKAYVPLEGLKLYSIQGW